MIDGGDLNINFMLLFGAEVLKQEALKQDGSHKYVFERSESGIGTA